MYQPLTPFQPLFLPFSAFSPEQPGRATETGGSRNKNPFSPSCTPLFLLQSPLLLLLALLPSGTALLCAGYPPYLGSEPTLSSSLPFPQAQAFFSIPALTLELSRCECSGESKFYTRLLKYLQATDVWPYSYPSANTTLNTDGEGTTPPADGRGHNGNHQQLPGAAQLKSSGQELQTDKGLLRNVSTE